MHTLQNASAQACVRSVCLTSSGYTSKFHLGILSHAISTGDCTAHSRILGCFRSIPKHVQPHEIARRWKEVANPAISPFHSQNSIILLSVNVQTSHCQPDIPGEYCIVFDKHVGSVLIQWIVGVGLQEEKVQPKQYRVERQHRGPVFPQDVKAYISFQIDVWMVNFLGALDAWRINREVLTNVHREAKSARFVVALSWPNGYVEFKQVCQVWEFDFHRGGQLKLGDVLL